MKLITSVFFSIILSCSLHVFFIIILFMFHNIYYETGKHVTFCKKKYPYMITILSSSKDVKPSKMLPNHRKLLKSSKPLPVSSQRLESKVLSFLENQTPNNSENIMVNIKNNVYLDRKNDVEACDNNYGVKTTDIDNSTNNIIDNRVILSTSSDLFPILYVYPEYPQNAKSLKIEGHVTVMYNIDAKGKVRKIRILSATSPGVFEKNIKFAMARWVYKIQKPKKDLVLTFKFLLNSA
ncbi:TonB family protein [Candidatus Blochmanniella vafra]|uniref:TonB family protein n=1 Tax=Candidatus Blochmanniella vafra TaxID=251535 RepID=UPI0011D199FE|nr:TonB family protein [Candidatus Blochmannia vafer]